MPALVQLLAVAASEVVRKLHPTDFDVSALQSIFYSTDKLYLTLVCFTLTVVVIGILHETFITVLGAQQMAASGLCK